MHLENTYFYDFMIPLLGTGIIDNKMASYHEGKYIVTNGRHNMFSKRFQITPKTGIFLQHFLVQECKYIKQGKFP